MKIALDQIDYGEFNGDVGFTQKLSSHVIIALEMFEKNGNDVIKQKLEQSGVLFWYQNNQHNLSFRLRVVCTVKHREDKNDT